MWPLRLALVTLLLSGSAFARTDGSREIKLVNNCEREVWLGTAGGSVGLPGGAQCARDADCPAGASCRQTGAIRQCFWNNPRPQGGDYRLPPGGEAALVVPSFEKNAIVWSGVISGRLGCKGGVCEVGDCGNDAGGCQPGRGFSQPSTQAEFTLQRKADDFYDITVINGVSLPIAMTPTSAYQNPKDAYRCGRPGEACSWHFTPPHNELRWVRTGGRGCFTNSDCQTPGSSSGNEMCGLSINPGQAKLLQMTCGEFLGYWTANQVCGVQPDIGCPFDCQAKAGRGADGRDITVTNLLQCTNVGSCYQNGATSSCCGCVDWSKQGVHVPFGTELCKATNPEWTKRVLPELQWLKQGCPSVYVYPYDDMSSTFVCSSMNATGVNTADYTITFCPMG